MTCLYYSKYCAIVKTILYKVSRNEIKDMHFLLTNENDR